MIAVNVGGFLVVGWMVNTKMGENRRREWERAQEKEMNENSL